MAQTKRKTEPVLNEPLSVLNVQRFVAFGALLLMAGIGFLFRSLLAWGVGLVAFLVLCGVAQVLQKLDSDWLQLIPAIWRFQMDRGYDPLEREPFTLIITGDDYEETND